MSRVKNWFDTYAEAASARKTRNENLKHILAKVTLKKGRKETVVEKYFLGKKEDLDAQKKKFSEVKVY